MVIVKTHSGATYCDYSNLLTISEWTDYIHAQMQGKAYPDIAEKRARELGGRKYRGRTYGEGFTFPKHTPESLKELAMEKYPELFEMV